MNSLEQRREEFFKFVWDHTKDPFLLRFDQRATLTPEEIGWLRRAYEYCFIEDEAEAVKSLRHLMVSGGKPTTLLLIQIGGLTRSKVITDLKSSLGERAPRRYDTLHKSDEGVKYLLTRLRRVFMPLHRIGLSSEAEELQHIFESLNQATYSGFIRQERAKRQGHEAEQRLAMLLHSLNIPFEPKERLQNPLFKDVKLLDTSFDLVVPNATDPKILVKSTVQTANIGQFGESKTAHEVEDAKTKIKIAYPQSPPPYLVALIDGIGFQSNREGLDRVLQCVHEFVQFRTLWKFAVIACSVTGRKLRIQSHPDLEYFQDFLKTYSSTVEICESVVNGVEAGFTWITIE